MGNDYGIQFWTPEMIKKGTAKNADNTISTLAATAGWYQANESLKEIVRRVIKEESGYFKQSVFVSSNEQATNLKKKILNLDNSLTVTISKQPNKNSKNPFNVTVQSSSNKNISQSVSNLLDDESL
jgi:hypothetical protein